jgi:hypothetical protein
MAAIVCAFAFFVPFAFRSNVLMALALVFALLVCMRHLQLFRSAERPETFLFVAVAVTLLISVQFAVWRNQTALAHVVVAASSMATAFVLTRNPIAYFRASALVLLMAQAAVGLFLWRNGLADFPLERMLPDSSSNGITSYLVILQANYCVALTIVTRRVAFLTPIATLLICVSGYGRSSIIAALAILLINAIVWLSGRKRGVKMLLVIVLGLVLSFIAVRFGGVIAEFVQANTKIGSGLVDSHRAEINQSYFEQINALSLFAGSDYSGTKIDLDYRGNPHNSFIRAHHLLGLPYVLLMIFFPVLLHRRFSGDRASRYRYAMILVMLARAVTEPVLFPSMLDFFYFGSCFLLFGGSSSPASKARPIGASS